MTVYQDYIVYGPYTRKSDGRQHVVLTLHDNNGKIIERKTISYPKYLVEKHLNRYLQYNETVDHIDEDFTNNDLSNLRVVSRSEHCKSHTTEREIVYKRCFICGKEFKTNCADRITCGSKSCAGKCAHLNGYNKGNSVERMKNTYKNNRSLIEEIQSVEGANSANLLIGNAELNHQK